MRSRLLVVLLPLLTAAASKGLSRLRGESRPLLYSLTLEPDIAGAKFFGRLSLRLALDRPSTSILLNSYRLDIASAAIRSPSPNLQVGVARVEEQEDDQTLEVVLDREAPPGEYLLEVEYSGLISNQTSGFYRSTYRDQNTTKELALTKLEPYHARTVFPCFDEPSYKAPFDLQVVLPAQPNYSVLSNMNIKVDTVEDGRRRVEFSRTPAMSAYTMCLVVSQFPEPEPAYTAAGLPVRAYGRPGLDLSYATQLAPKALDFFAQYLNSTYDLPKLDLVAAPDFASGAMENWGLSTFRESSIVLSEGVSGPMDHWSVTKTLCHELSHMWFGNLVTMKWWDEIWLNEGFATFMAAKCIQALRPDLHDEELELVKKVQGVMEEDSEDPTHPLVNEITSLQQIPFAFDHIAYNKGGAILAMVEASLGEEEFQRGVRRYVGDHALSTASTSDLWTALGAPWADEWARLPGLPLVNVSPTPAGLVLTQQSFARPNSGHKWNIPIFYKTASSGEKKQIMFPKDSDEVLIELDEGEKWYKLNADQTGYFRVNYPVEVWQLHEKYLHNMSDELSWRDRAGLLDDSFALASEGAILYDVPLSLTSYLTSGQETNLAPWRVAASSLNGLKKRLQNTSANQLFMKYVRLLIQPTLEGVLKRIDSPTEPNDMKQVDSVVLALGCSFRVTKAIRKVRSIFNKWIEENISMTPYTHIHGTIYRYGVGGDNEERNWLEVWSRYTNESDPHQLLNLRRALTSIKNQVLLARLLQLAKNDTYVRSQDFLGMMKAMGSKKTSVSVVWNFVKEEWPYLEKKFEGNEKKLCQVVKTVTSSFNTQERVEEVEEFYSKYPSAALCQKNSDKPILSETLKKHKAWGKANVNLIRNYLKYTLNERK